VGDIILNEGFRKGRHGIAIALYFEVTMLSRIHFSNLLLLILCLSHNASNANDQTNIEVIEVLSSNDFSSANYQILQRDDFINSAQTLSDVLKSINGIQIRQISGLGNPVSISIRGSSSKQVQLYIDGQLINDSQFGGFDLNQIPTEQIESIEISKNQAIGTGATPIGGVIRINTFNPSEDSKKMSLAVGSFGFKEINLMQNSAFKIHSLSVGGSLITTDNDYSYLVPQSFDDSSKSVVQPLTNNQYDKTTLFINDNIIIGQHQIRLNAQYNKQSKALPNYQNNSPNNSSKLDSDSLRFSYQHYWLAPLPWIDTFEFEMYHDDKNELYLDSPDGKLSDTSEYDTKKQYIALKPHIALHNFKLTPFLNFSKQKFKSLSKHNGKPNTCNGISGCDIYAKQEKTNLGARLEYQSDKHPLSSYALLSKLSEKNSNQAVNQTEQVIFETDNRFYTQEIGLNYKLKSVVTSLNFSKGVRTPTLFELFGDRGSFKGNNNLLPEEANTLSLSAQYQQKQFSISSSIYQQSLDNSIVAIFNSSNVGSYTNISNADLTGFEIQSNYTITPALTLVAQANLITSETQSEYTSFDDKKLPGIYHQQYSAAIKFQATKDWRLSFTTHLDKELYFNRNNKFENDNNIGNGTPADRVVSDFSVNWQSNSHNANLIFNNVFNADYQDLANRPAQGRSIQLKYSLQGI